MTLGGHRKEDQFWVQTMTALAKYLGAPSATVHARTVCVDPRRQWGNVSSMSGRTLWCVVCCRTMTAPAARFARRRQRED